MRSFRDNAGQQWDADVQGGSYGAHVIVFVARGGGEVRQSALMADDRLSAEREFHELDDEDLRRRLGEAVGLDSDPFLP
ncbi:MAG: hypothetical protein PVH31_00325 [Ectothiorhodospiraceae bacterium]|jgi:hypothetical protein